MSNIVCMECGAALGRIHANHLRKHNMSLLQYKEKYPDAVVVSAATRDKLRTNSLAHFVSIHGETDGPIKYEEYKAFQAVKNTREYKKSKGMTDAQIDEYNNSRASTLANFVRRYGETEGQRKWCEYCNTQRVAGVSLEWFQQKYGDIAGSTVWNKVKATKSHSLTNLQQRYGVDEGMSRYLQMIDRLANTGVYISAIERDMVDAVLAILPAVFTHYDYTSKQYTRWCDTLNSIVMYDMVLQSPTHKICIEFHGDYWHCNPSIYQPDFVHPHKNITAAEIWNRDTQKIQLMEDAGFTTLIVWETEWKMNKQQVMEKIKQCLM